MRLRHRPSPVVSAASAEPSTDVRIVVAPRRSEEYDGYYLVQDALGAVHDTGTRDRREALRELGGFAVRGAAAPLILLGPDGSPTGDRIA